MRFPLVDRIGLPCVFERLVPGEPHPDGRRYLPQLLLRPTGMGGALPTGLLLSVVDRHHRVDESAVGQAGVARLVCALSAVALQREPYRRGLMPEEGWHGGISRAPLIAGRVLEVAAWEAGTTPLPYETLYLELALDIGVGVVGLRTNITAANLEAALGTPRIKQGDHIMLTRSRIDILKFEAI